MVFHSVIRHTPALEENMPRRKTIIDCDPGQDDAVMLLLAMASPAELDILGITTVAGNVPLDLTQRNARLMCELAGREDVPVYAGSGAPLVRELITAENVHGSTGIDGADIHAPSIPLQDGHAVDFITETLLNAEPGSITLVPTGPLTNIGRAISRTPEILAGIREIVMMGGAMREGGNTSPSAEFNILVDPHAAEIVMRCGRPLTIAPLDVTHQVVVTQACLEALRGNRSKAIDWLRQSVEAGYANADWMAKDSDLQSLHSDPEFEAIVGEAKKQANEE